MKTDRMLPAIMIMLGYGYTYGQTETPDTTVMLEDVVVSAYVPQVRTEGPVSTIKVRGTMLSRMGNASTVLANTPGLHKGASGIEVNGMGKPVFLLDGREIDPDKVLEMLQANTIKEIKINRMPDSSHSATAQCTVEIITFRQPDDYLSLTIGNDMFIRRKFSDAGNFNAGFQTKKFTSTLDYTGGVVQFQNRETYFRDVYHENYVSSFDQKRKNDVRETPHRLRFAADYDLNKYNRFGIEYFYNHSSRSDSENGTDSYENADGVTEGKLSRRQHRLSNVHNLTLQYNYKRKTTSLQIVQDFTATTSESDINSFDFTGISPIDTYSHNRYRMSTTNVRFSTKLPWKLSMTTGAKYIYIDNEGHTASDASAAKDHGYVRNTEIKEHNPQVFLSLARKFGQLRVTAGARYQYLHRKTISTVSGGDDVPLSRGVSSLFPSLSFNYTWNNGNSIYLRYARTVDRPNFSAMNMGMTYIDSLTYSNGNPDLRSSFSDIVTAGFNWKDFTISARFTHESAPIVNVSEMYENGTDIAVEGYVNFGKANNLDLSLSYSKTIRRLNMYADAAVGIPHGKYIFRDKECTADRISFDCNINLNYRITSNVGIYTSFNYQGSREYLTLKQKEVNNLTVGVAASLLNNKLTINAAFTDILHGANYNNLAYRYGNIVNGTYGTNDQRGFMLRISYAIFTKKIKTKTAHDNDESISRTL